MPDLVPSMKELNIFGLIEARSSIFQVMPPRKSMASLFHNSPSRRAVGATQREILLQFLSEAVIISVAGGVAGIIAEGG